MMKTHGGNVTTVMDRWGDEDGSIYTEDDGDVIGRRSC